MDLIVQNWAKEHSCWQTFVYYEREVLRTMFVLYHLGLVCKVIIQCGSTHGVGTTSRFDSDLSLCSWYGASCVVEALVLCLLY